MTSDAQGLPALERIEEEWLDPALIESVPVDWVRRHGVVPFRRNGQVTIAGAPGGALQAYEDLALLLGAEAVWVSAPAAEIQRAIDRCYFRRAGRPDEAAAPAAAPAETAGLVPVEQPSALTAATAATAVSAALGATAVQAGPA